MSDDKIELSDFKIEAIYTDGDGLSFFQPSHEVLRINADGTIEICPGLKPDEAGRQVIDGMRDQLKLIVAQARSAALEDAAKVAEGYRSLAGEKIAASIRELKEQVTAT